MKNCKSCGNWIDATAECSIALRAIANDNSIPKSVEAALGLDSNAENDCSYHD